MPMNQQSDTEWRVRLCLWDYAVTNEDMRHIVNNTATQSMEMLNGLVGYLQEINEIKTNIDKNIIAQTLYNLCIGTGFNMLHTDFIDRPDQLNPLFSYIESIRA